MVDRPPATTAGALMRRWLRHHEDVLIVGVLAAFVIGGSGLAIWSELSLKAECRERGGEWIKSTGDSFCARVERLQ